MVAYLEDRFSEFPPVTVDQMLILTLNAYQSLQFLTEGKENKVHLTIGDSFTISSLLKYLYTLDYEYAIAEGQSDTTLVSHVNVFIAADFYDIPQLKELAVEKFQNALPDLWKTDQFPKALEAVYSEISSSDLLLRNIAIETIIRESSTLLSSTDTSVTDIMVRVPELGMELVLAMQRKSEKLNPKWEGFRKVQCQTCRHIWADARAVFPNPTNCPGCNVPRYEWDRFQVV